MEKYCRRPGPADNADMRRKIFAIILAAVLLPAARAADTFTGRLTAEEQRQAGLDRLTPAQLNALNDLVARDRAGELQKARAAARAEAVTAVKAEAKAEARTEFEAERKAENEFESQIVGPFHGWTGHTYFPLANGQIWEQTDADQAYYTSAADASGVIIRKTWAGGYVLVVKALKVDVKVRRVQ
jgi:hypothetical protein